MMRILRGKRLVFVGDSLNRNMWESLVCSLRSTLEDKNRVHKYSGRQNNLQNEGFYGFRFKVSVSDLSKKRLMIGLDHFSFVDGF